ncbi:hypothetical protein [Pedobacter sp. P26]|uniref:hypothetical protein n=1 Tax=Pedobacter sp. P26 TaxID=3423956 RepID=UPI003D667E71
MKTFDQTGQSRSRLSKGIRLNWTPVEKTESVNITTKVIIGEMVRFEKNTTIEAHSANRKFLIP